MGNERVGSDVVPVTMETMTAPESGADLESGEDLLSAVVDPVDLVVAGSVPPAVVPVPIPVEPVPGVAVEAVVVPVLAGSTVAELEVGSAFGFGKVAALAVPAVG